MKTCRICGEEKEDVKFKAFKKKDGTTGRNNICNLCRSRRDSVKVREREDALKGYSDIDLIYALQLRGYRIITKKMQ